MRIGHRLILLLVVGFGFGAATAGWIGFTATRSARDIDRSVTVGFAAMQEADAAEAAFFTLATDLADFLDMTTLPDMQTMHARFEGGLARLDGAIDGLDALADPGATPASSAMAAPLAAVRAARDAWRGDARILLGLDPAPEVPTLERLDRATAALAGALGDAGAAAAAEAAAAASSARATLASDLRVAGGVGLLVMLAAAAWGLFTARGVSRGLASLAATMDALSRGEIDTVVSGGARHDEIGAMARAVTVFQTALRQRDALEAAQRAEDARALERAARQETMFQRLSDVVDAGARGDFTLRMARDGLDLDQTRLADAVNRLLGVVDDGVGAVAKLLDELAHSNLAARMDGDFEGAFARLQNDAAITTQRLADALSEVQRQSVALQSGTRSLSHGSHELKARTERQTDALRDTGTNMDAIWHVVQTNAGRSKTAVTRTESAVASADKGQKVMEDTVTAMKGIEDGSRQIAEIVTVIESIAFQTNLLALNAAVEAARAGDAGKGFAVVASEVRTLALRCSDAARDISAVVGDNSRRILSGTGMARNAGQALVEIKAGVSEMADLVREIATDNDHVARSIDAIKTSVHQLDDITRKNVEVADQTGRTVEEFEGLARGLAAIANVFQIGADASVDAVRHPSGGRYAA